MIRVNLPSEQPVASMDGARVKFPRPTRRRSPLDDTVAWGHVRAGPLEVVVSDLHRHLESVRLDAHRGGHRGRARSARQKWTVSALARHLAMTATPFGLTCPAPANAEALSPVSTAGYVTVCTVMGWENDPDHLDGFSVTRDRERGRDPSQYCLRVFGDPGGLGVTVRRSPRLAEQPHRRRAGQGRQAVLHRCGPRRGTTARPRNAAPAGPAADLVRDLARSRPPPLRGRAVLLDRAPSDIIGGYRARLADGCTSSGRARPSPVSRPTTAAGAQR